MSAAPDASTAGTAGWGSAAGCVGQGIRSASRQSQGCGKQHLLETSAFCKRWDGSFRIGTAPSSPLRKSETSKTGAAKPQAVFTTLTGSAVSAGGLLVMSLATKMKKNLQFFFLKKNPQHILFPFKDFFFFFKEREKIIKFGLNHICLWK